MDAGRCALKKINVIMDRLHIDSAACLLYNDVLHNHYVKGDNVVFGG